MKKHTVDIAFFEDFTFSVSISVAPPYPDVGIFESGIDDWGILSVDGCKDKSVLELFTKKLETKLHAEAWREAMQEAIPSAADEAAERADYLYEQRRDREMDR